MHLWEFEWDRSKGGELRLRKLLSRIREGKKKKIWGRRRDVNITERNKRENWRGGHLKLDADFGVRKLKRGIKKKRAELGFREYLCEKDRRVLRSSWFWISVWFCKLSDNRMKYVMTSLLETSQNPKFSSFLLSYSLYPPFRHLNSSRPSVGTQSEMFPSPIFYFVLVETIFVNHLYSVCSKLISREFLGLCRSASL